MCTARVGGKPVPTVVQIAPPKGVVEAERAASALKVPTVKGGVSTDAPTEANGGRQVVSSLDPKVVRGIVRLEKKKHQREIYCLY